MENESILSIAEEWKKKTYDVMSLKESLIPELEELLLDTYNVLYNYHTEKSVPKELALVLLNLEEYMHFLAMLGSNEEALTKSHCMYQALYCIIDAMKKGFFQGEYENVFPKCQVNINGTVSEINMEEAFLEKLLDL